MYSRTADDSVVDEQGRVLHFSGERFTRDIVEGDCCFICGIAREQADALARQSGKPDAEGFNDEHVLPDWILKAYDVRQDALQLPNNTDHIYGKYKIPCCVACNDLLGQTFEVPLSHLLKRGFTAVKEYIGKNGQKMLVAWLALIFLKTHLKDKLLPDSQRHGLVAGSIANVYRHDWSALHHLHCLVRAFIAGWEIEPAAQGRLLLFKALPDEQLGRYDFVDRSLQQCLLLRLEDFALLVIFNDCGIVADAVQDLRRKCKGAFSALQLREWLVEAAWRNHHVTAHPEFFTRYDPARQRFVLTADLTAVLQLVRDNVKVVPDMSTRADLLHSVYAQLWRDAPALLGERSLAEAEAILATGRLSYLFRADNSFIHHG